MSEDRPANHSDGVGEHLVHGVATAKGAGVLAQAEDRDVPHAGSMMPPKAATVEKIQPTHRAYKEGTQQAGVGGAGDAQEARWLGRVDHLLHHGGLLLVLDAIVNL